MDILYSLDENYIVQAAASICSLFENNRLEKEIIIHVLAHGLREESVRALESIGDIYTVSGRMEFMRTGTVPEGFTRRVIFVPADRLMERIAELAGSDINDGRFTAAAYMRLFAPEYLPDGIKRFLYIDSDTLVLRPLNVLFNSDLKGRATGMVPEPTIYKELKADLGLSETEPYFNSGVILFDREKWDAGRFAYKCALYLKNNRDRLRFPDQDIINHVLKGEITALHPGCNFFSNYHYRSYKSLVRLAPWYGDYVSREDYEAAKSLPVIVHFAGDERPWYEGCMNYYVPYFDRYHALSPFADREKIKGYEWYMFKYHILNLVTSICPAVRDMVSRHYYHKTVKPNGADPKDRG